MSATLGLSEPLQVSDADVILAREAGRVLANLTGQDRAVRIEATEGPRAGAAKPLSFQRPPCGLLIDVFGEIARRQRRVNRPCDLPS